MPFPLSVRPLSILSPLSAIPVLALPIRIGAVLLVLLSATGTAQASPCKSLLDSAQEHYVEQRFSDAEAAVRTCLGRSYVAPGDAVASHRLLALVHLRQDKLVEAKYEVMQLLGISFDYQPDPILDPPAFASLVQTVRNQLRVDVEAFRAAYAESPGTPEPPCACADSEDSADAVADASSGAELAAQPQAMLRSVGSVHLGVAIGGGSYSGERGINAPTLLGEFSQNGGISFAIDGAYYLTSTLAVAVQLHAVRFPLLFSNDVRAEDVQVRPDDSSEWVQALTVLARSVYWSDGRAAPYVQLGLSGIVSRLNREVRVAVGPQVGFGVDVAATPRLSGFAEFNLLVAIPGDAVDRVDTSDGPGDMLTFAGVGARYRLGLW